MSFKKKKRHGDYFSEEKKTHLCVLQWGNQARYTDVQVQNYKP